MACGPHRGLALDQKLRKKYGLSPDVPVVFQITNEEGRIVDSYFSRPSVKYGIEILSYDPDDEAQKEARKQEVPLKELRIW